MQPIPGQVQDRSLIQRNTETRNSAVSTAVKEIPYDYVATFTLKGQFGNRIPQVINLSTDGAFVAVAIAYSFIPARLPAFLLEKVIPETTGTPVIPPASPLSFPASLLDLYAQSVAAKLSAGTFANADNVRDQLINAIRLIADPQMLQCLLTRLCGIDFKYSIVDSGSGRELQNLSIHNIAGLGEPSGERPFRPMAKPMIFMPRSTIRIEVEEISTGPLYEKAELYIVLHGYKMLGYGLG